MFNYGNLNDSEFELLSCDIMSKILNTKLHTFSKGRDGGIDVTDNVFTKNCKRQVLSSKKWHLISSTFWQIKSSTYAYIPLRIVRRDFFN